jgi:hypothetical protein
MLDKTNDLNVIEGGAGRTVPATWEIGVRAERLHDARVAMTVGRPLPPEDIARELAKNVERFVDAHGLYALVSALGDVCALQAERLSHAWMDEATSRQWAKAAKRVQALYRALQRIRGINKGSEHGRDCAFRQRA